MLGNSGTKDDPYAYTSRDLINAAANMVTGDYDHGTRPVSDVETILVNGLGVPPKPTKKFFDTGYKVGLTIKGIVTSASEPTNPLLGTETFIDLLRRAARKLNSIDINKAGLTLGRYADATGSQGGFRKALKHLNGGKIPFLLAGNPITWGVHKPQIDEQGREVTEMESAPDNFGRNTRISRIVTPRRDGTFKNDTVYGVRFMSNGTLDATSYDMKGKQYGLSPRNSIGKPFDKWGEYFKHVMSLKKQQTPQTTPAQKPSSSNYYLSMAM